MSCAPEASGLREVYFEYDDENEYIARAHDDEASITRWAGTTEQLFPVVASALFDAGGSARAIRLITDPRPEFRDDVFTADLRNRADAYIFGAVMAARFNIEPTDCVARQLAEGEGAIAGVAIKKDCMRLDAEHGWRVKIATRYYRKVGQNAYDPRTPGRATKGEFESSARLDVIDTRSP